MALELTGQALTLYNQNTLRIRGDTRRERAELIAALRTNNDLSLESKLKILNKIDECGYNLGMLIAQWDWAKEILDYIDFLIELLEIATNPEAILSLLKQRASFVAFLPFGHSFAPIGTYDDWWNFGFYLAYRGSLENINRYLKLLLNIAKRMGREVIDEFLARKSILERTFFDVAAIRQKGEVIYFILQSGLVTEKAYIGLKPAERKLTDYVFQLEDRMLKIDIISLAIHQPLSPIGRLIRPIKGKSSLTRYQAELEREGAPPLGISLKEIKT